MSNSTKVETAQVKDLKIAFVHQSYWLDRGAERLAQKIMQQIPHADMYALFGNRKYMAMTFPGKEVKLSWLQYVPLIKWLYRYSIPLWPFTIELWDFSKYDLVISTSSAFMKGIVVPWPAKHLAIILTPTRYLWDLSSLYYKNAFPLRRIPMFLFYTLLRIWDVLATDRPDKIVPISEFVGSRIKKYYRLDCEDILYPPVELSQCSSSIKRDDFYLAISPFEEHKGGGELLEAVKETGCKVKIIGNGNLKGKYRKEIKKLEQEGMVEYLGWVTEDTKYNMLSRAKGLFYLGVEDFGIVPVEAVASGCPVLALNKGGVKETVIDGLSGILIDNITKDSIVEGLSRIEDTPWDRIKMQESITQYDVNVFENKLNDLITNVVNE